MAIKIIKKGIEVERLIGQREVQMQVRAEALVPGAGRESVEALMADGFASVTSAEAQADRVVVSGNVFCQAAYRLGQEGGARALTAQAPFEQITLALVATEATGRKAISDSPSYFTSDLVQATIAPTAKTENKNFFIIVLIKVVNMFCLKF